MTEEISKKANEIAEKIVLITKICQNLINEEYTLQDLVSEEENLDNNLEELKEIMQEIIHLRQWLGLEQIQ